MKMEKKISIANAMLKVGLIALVLLAAGCGYRVNNSSPALKPGKTIVVEPFTNRTAYYKIDQVFTRSMINELVRATDYRIESESPGADAVLQSTILGLKTSPVTFSKSSFASTFLVTVNARVQLIDRASNKLLYENRDIRFSEQYVINTDVENFFSEMNPALMRLADDFSSTVVAAILEDF